MNDELAQAMKPASLEQAIFAGALLLEAPAARAAYLDEACGTDAPLRKRVESLLLAAENAGDFLEQPPTGLSNAGGSFVIANVSSEKPGDKIGRYKLLQQIGEGGCGVVYMAEQEEPVRRRVALKVIKLGMDTKAVMARFEAERQALALMDHPNIAKVLDAGATETGRPYFVMELVRGIKITDYCDQNQLPTEERLKLFTQVCQAIQHAHQKGIIHRDIKPSNILVTINDPGSPGCPKVIDFGIAKATTGQRLTDMTVFTAFEQFIGTPAYMSPEQAMMTSLDIDTRADIYALGVLLYELLTGRTPFDAKELIAGGLDAMRRIILEQEPARPSTRLSTLMAAELTTVASHRHSEPARLRTLLRGDLDWIVMKALEKDRSRRYETANGLAADVQRHLRNEPVVARPPSAGYRFQKLVRRNKLVFSAAAAVTMALVVGIAASLRQTARALKAERRAAAALDELRASAPAFAEQARALAAKEQFADAILKLDSAIKLRPDAAEYLVAKGDLLQCQLKLAAAAAIYREALRVKPSLTRAETSANLCDELLAAPASAEGRLSRESLAKLHLAMQQQQRPAAELMPVARRLGQEKKLLLDYWLARLKDLPVSSEYPLAKRLSVRDDGRLALDLGGTKVIDLSPLVGAPLAALDVSRSKELIDLSALRGLDLIDLNLSGTSVADLAPLRDMHRLAKLNLSNSKVADLGPLSALRLKSLDFRGCPVSDLNPIRKMLLEDVNLRETRVADLSPLIGMPIKSIDLSMAPVLDFSPLAQLPLEKCILQRNRITDLAVLRGKPLKELVLWGSVEARHYAVLTEITTLELLLLPAEYRDLPAEDYAAIAALRDHPRLRQLGSEIMNQMGIEATGSKDLFWQDWDREQTFVPALRNSGIRFSLVKLSSGSYSLRIENQPLRDLSILKGAPVSDLVVWNCPFSDLTPLRGLPLESLFLSSELIGDLNPLRGMPLKILHLKGSMISDLCALKELPLRELYLDGCENVTDVAPLAEIPTLERLTIPMQAGNTEVLRGLPGLQMVGFARVPDKLLPTTTTEEFWKDYPWFKRLRDSGFKARALARRDDGTWEAEFTDSPIVDLSLLQGARITRLFLGNTAVSDLTPLRGMPLKHLALWATKVTDLSPLQGMPIEALDLAGTKVADISALRAMPLMWLKFNECAELTDLSPRADCKELRTITLPPKARNLEPLRALPKLERISFRDNSHQLPDMTAKEFWKEYDQRNQAAGEAL
jgi:serine/threonine protein kinase/Leucine-rich repeat (LRR) protein